MIVSGATERANRVSTALAARAETAAQESSIAPRPTPPRTRSPRSGTHAVSMPWATQEMTEVRVARASEGLPMMIRIPAARSLINGAVRAPRARPGRAGNLQAAGSAKVMSTTETTTADGAPSASATTPARAGPARLAALNVMASSAFARGRRSPDTTRGSWAVHPPDRAGPSSPVTTATAIVTANGHRPSPPSSTPSPVAYRTRAPASRRPGRAALSRNAPSTGPPTAAETVIPASSDDASTVDPATAKPASSSAGPDISSPARAATAPARYERSE
ncbi:hypothetical protein RKD37_008452 [Streptomyces ambofaciens]